MRPGTAGEHRVSLFSAGSVFFARSFCRAVNLITRQIIDLSFFWLQPLTCNRLRFVFDDVGVRACAALGIRIQKLSELPHESLGSMRLGWCN